MICYFDTSAFVPLLVNEPGTPLASRLWQEADQVVSSHLLYVETAAALAQARRMDRLDVDGHGAAVTQLDTLFGDFHVMEVDDRLVRRAARLADELALRGFDAMHCAAAERLADPELVFVAGDSAVLRAGSKLGLATADTNAQS